MREVLKRITEMEIKTMQTLEIVDPRAKVYFEGYLKALIDVKKIIERMCHESSRLSVLQKRD